MPFGTEKLEYLACPMMKNFEDIFIRLDKMWAYERDRHTDTA